MLWRLGRRRGSRRLIFLSALAALLVFAPQAAATPPDIQVTIFGTLGSNGWYRSNVTVNWDVTGEENSSGCDARTLTADTAGTKITCTATSGGGLEESIKSVTVKPLKFTYNPANPDPQGIDDFQVEIPHES